MLCLNRNCEFFCATITYCLPRRRLVGLNMGMNEVGSCSLCLVYSVLRDNIGKPNAYTVSCFDLKHCRDDFDKCLDKESLITLLHFTPPFSFILQVEEHKQMNQSTTE